MGHAPLRFILILFLILYVEQHLFIGGIRKELIRDKKLCFIRNRSVWIAGGVAVAIVLLLPCKYMGFYRYDGRNMERRIV